MGEGTLGNSTRERLQPRSPHMTFYRDVQTALDEDEELESASMRDTQTSAGAGGVYPGSQSSSRPDTPSTTHSQEMASNTRPRRGTNRLQAREDRSGVVPSRWNITSDAEVDSEDLGAWDSSQTSERTSSPGHSNRRRRSTGLLHASPLLWQSDARVWARSTDSIKLPTAVAEPLGSTPEKKPTLGKKRLLAKRESAQLLSNSNSALSSGINEKDLTSLNNSFSYGANGPRSSTWLWRRAQISLSSSGLLIITTTDDRIPIHSIPTTLLARTDFRLVDSTLFSQNFCISIRITATRPAKLDPSPRSPSATSFLSNRPNTASSSIPFLSSFNRSHSSETTPPASSLAALSIHNETIETTDYVYICLDSSASQRALFLLLQSFGQAPTPELSQLAPYDSAEELRVSLQPVSPAGSSSVTSIKSADRQPRPPTAKRVRTWRSLDLTIMEGRNVGNLDGRPKGPSSDDWSTAAFSPTQATPSHPLAPSSSSKDFTTTTSSASSIKTNRDEPQHGTLSTSGKFFIEVVLDKAVVGKSSTQKGSQAPFWQDKFSFQDLPPFEQPLQLRVYVLVMRKGVRQVGCVGTVDIPLQTMKRSEQIEAWFPIVAPYVAEDAFAGELLLSIRLSEIPVLVPSEYQPLSDLLADINDRNILYDVASNLADLESSADMLLRICLEQGTLRSRLMQMVETEIDGDENTANILFRGNTLFTKLFEQYIRLIGSDFLHFAIGDVVAAICRDAVELEIDPARLKPHHRPLMENVTELQRWAAYLWNSLYQARHRCPNDLRIIFSHIQSVVEERYESHSRTRRFTCVSAFVFLRFFVPALLNPKQHGLTTTPPSAACHRTLTLLAKTCIVLANMSTFKNKEEFMIVMNPFVEENEAAFVDFITSVATPLPSPEDSARCTMSNTEALQQSVASQRRASIQDELQRDSLPTLPHLLNLSKDLAMLATLSLRCAQHHESKQTSQEGQKAQRRPRFLSKNFERFLDLCYHYHRMAQVQARPSHINGSLYLPQLVSADMQLLPVEPATQTANPNPHRAGTSPFSDDLGRADSFNVTGNNGNRFGFKMSSPRRNRAQTVSSGGARNANIREPVTTTTTDAALDLPAFSEYTADDAPNLPSSPGPGIFFSQSVKTETTHRAEDASSIASDSGASVSRSSLSVNSEQKTGRLQRMLNRG